MKIRNLYFQVYCVIFCECVLQRQMHIEKRTQSWCTACLIFPDGKICILDLHTQHPDQETACYQKPPCSLPITTALFCPPPRTSSCLFFFLLHGFGFQHSTLLLVSFCRSFISIAIEYSLGEDTTIHLTILLFMAIRVLGTFWLSHIVLPWAVHHTSFGKHMESLDALLLITVKVTSAFLVNSGSSL